MVDGCWLVNSLSLNVSLSGVGLQESGGPRPGSGYIGLQNHDPLSTAYFKEVSVKPLK